MGLTELILLLGGFPPFLYIHYRVFFSFFSRFVGKTAAVVCVPEFDESFPWFPKRKNVGKNSADAKPYTCPTCGVIQFSSRFL